MDYEKIRNALIKFRDERDWKQFHNPKDLATAMCIEASELEELFLWKSQEDSYEIWKNDPKVKEEFADVFNYLVLFAEACWIDIEEAVLSKIEKNGQKYPVEKAKGRSDKYTKL